MNSHNSGMSRGVASHGLSPLQYDGGGGMISAGGELYDPHAEPKFLTSGERLEVILGDTVVLPCKLDNLGKCLMLMHMDNYKSWFQINSPAQKIISLK